MSARAPRRIPAWLWLWLPPVAVVAQVALKAADEDAYRRWMRGETGLVETLTFVLLVVAVVLAVRLFALRRRVASPLFGPWALVLALGCAFFAGEEASWGQHWLGYEPPAAIAERNEQGELNLHNDPLLETVLDQLPRALLTLAALVGSLVAVVRLRRGRPARDLADPRPAAWAWPTVEIVPAAVVLLTVTLPRKVARAAGGELAPPLRISPGETKELCLAILLLVYVWSLWRDVPRERDAPARASGALPS